MFGGVFDLSLAVGRKFDCFQMFGRVFDRGCLSLVVSSTIPRVWWCVRR